MNKKRKRLNNFYLFCYIGLLPAILLYVIFRIIPIVDTFRLSFYSWSVLGVGNRFIGLQNYFKLFQDKLFITALVNTTLFAVFVVFFSVVISLALAIMLNNKRMERFSPIYELIYFLPVVTPMVPVAVMWKWIYDPQYGLLNYFLSLFGISPKAWLVYPDLALYAIVIMSVWKIVGYYMMIFLVGLKNISKEYYEAALIDGAVGWQVFRYITLPLLRPIVLYVLVVATIQAFNVFTQVYVMTSDVQGAPGRLVRVLVYDIYENGFRYFKMGYASAEAVILLLIVLVLTVFEFRVMGKEN